MMHWVTRYDPETAAPFQDQCDCPIGRDHLHPALRKVPHETSPMVPYGGPYDAQSICPWGGELIVSCKRSGLCDCFAFPLVDQALSALGHTDMAVVELPPDQSGNP